MHTCIHAGLLKHEIEWTKWENVRNEHEVLALKLRRRLRLILRFDFILSEIGLRNNKSAGASGQNVVHLKDRYRWPKWKQVLTSYVALASQCVVYLKTRIIIGSLKPTTTMKICVITTP
jgi:hypothetical protein